jgi:UDP-galactopyranose mutase
MDSPGRSRARPPRCAVVGAGLTGATAAWALRRQGFDVVVFEREKFVGGHVRNEWLRDVPYEPNGAHIFHTSDAEVWRLASSLVDFVPYDHIVKTRVGSHMLSWPIQMDEVRDLAEWRTIARELASRPATPDSSNFRAWCVSVMGETLYELFIDGYTRKQWGCDPSELSTEFAPKRVELRNDGYLGLFRDPYQGWPRQGYTALVEALLADAKVVLCDAVDAANIAEHVEPNVPVILTCPLDDFYDDVYGALEWRGVRLVPEWLPHTQLELAAMVVNEPDIAVPYTRSIETKWVFPELHARTGTVVCREYPDAPVKHYPVYDAGGRNRALQARYDARLRAEVRNPYVPAGRLANYLYINMDEAMRQGLDAAAKVAAASYALAGAR